MAEEKKENKEENKEEQKEEKKEEVKGEAKEETKEEKKEEQPTEEKKEDATTEEPEKEIEVPEKFKDIVETVEKMTVLDLAELVKILEKKFGVSAAAPVAAVPTQAGANGGQAGGEEEAKSEFNIQLAAPGEKKIDVIKVVRDVTGKGLKESKDLVDAAVNEPQMVKEGVKKEEAEEVKKKFEAAGAKIELQ
jgi:large subunit ribosomal protein L7/L12